MAKLISAGDKDFGYDLSDVIRKGISLAAKYGDQKTLKLLKTIEK